MSRLPVHLAKLAALVVITCVASMSVAGSADAAPKKSKKPTTTEAPKKDDSTPDFDKAAASTAITELSLQKCKATNATKGEGHVIITFAPAGNVQTATIDKGPWLGTPVAKCMTKEFKKAKVPVFKGDPVTVGKTFQFE